MITGSTRSSQCLTQDLCFTGGRGEGIDKNWNYNCTLCCQADYWRRCSVGMRDGGRGSRGFLGATKHLCITHTRASMGCTAMTSGRRYSWVSTISAGLPPERCQWVCVCFCVCISTRITSSRVPVSLQCFWGFVYDKVSLYTADKIIQCFAITHLHDEALGLAKEKEYSVKKRNINYTPFLWFSQLIGHFSVF